MRAHVIYVWTKRDDAVALDRPRRTEDTGLHALDIADVGDTRRLIKIAKIVREIGIILDAPQVALVTDIGHRIEADEIGEEPPVGLRLRGAAEIALLAQDNNREWAARCREIPN